MHISMTHGDVTLYSADDTEQLIRNAAAKGMEEFWVSGEDKYPALVILVNGSYAYLNYFGAKEDDMYMSVGDCGHDVEFIAGCEQYIAPGDTVVSLDDAVRAMHEFCCSFKRPGCISWQDGV